MKTALESWHELCATFSVKDHTYPGAFIAEVLLYDRLIIPVIATEANGLTKEQARKEWDRWKSSKKGWDPARQKQLVGILKNKLQDRVIEVPWTPVLQAEWKAKRNDPTHDAPESLEKLVARRLDNARRDGYFLTGDILQQFAPAMAKTVVAVSPFRSLKDLETRASVRPVGGGVGVEPLPAASLMTVLGFELFVPGDPDRNDFDLLSEAAEVASDPAYRTKRTALYLWQQRFIAQGKTDAVSIKTALKEMRGLVTDLRKETGWKWLKHVFTFFKGGADVAKIAHPVAAEVGGTLLSIGAYAVDQALGGGEVDALGKPAAALVMDAQKRIGLTLSGKGGVELKASKKRLKDVG